MSLPPDRLMVGTVSPPHEYKAAIKQAIEELKVPADQRERLVARRRD